MSVVKKKKKGRKSRGQVCFRIIPSIFYFKTLIAQAGQELHVASNDPELPMLFLMPSKVLRSYPCTTVDELWQPRASTMRGKHISSKAFLRHAKMVLFVRFLVLVCC